MFVLCLLWCFLYGAQSKRNPVFPDDFKFSAKGKPSGYNCQRITTKKNFGVIYSRWTDNYFCWKRETKNPGITFHRLPVSGKRCVKIVEPSRRKLNRNFKNRYLCVPRNSYLHLSWTSTGQTKGRQCIRWYEKFHSWGDNYLCSNDKYIKKAAVFPGDFEWSSGGKPVGYDCERIYEPKGGSTWRDNYFCWKNYRLNPGIKWSSSGPISGMRCTKITEPAERRGWHDNFLCVPRSSALHFVWSYKGISRKRRKYCIRWLETADGDGWDDNYLCLKK